MIEERLPVFVTGINIPGDGSALTKAFKEMGIELKWEPYSAPLFDMKDIKPIILGDCSEHKFQIAVPNKKP